MTPSQQYSLIPGPSRIEANVLEEYAKECGSPDIDDAFWNDYYALEGAMQQFLKTDNSVVMMSGEGMVALWGAMKSVIRPGDRVVCGANGLYGHGFADMAKSLGAQVTIVEGEWHTALDISKLISTIKEVDPHLVTMVHCETPSGILNSLEGVGDAVKSTSDGLFLVDFVASAVGADLEVDAWGIDIGLLGSQKVLSGPPALAMTSVSPKAWTRINAVKYQGYDAFAAFFPVALHPKEGEDRLMPYTHNWHAVRAMLRACMNIEENGGVEASIQRHEHVARVCRSLAKDMGIEVYSDEGSSSPTVTALKVPEGIEWKDLLKEMNKEGVFLGGSYGPLAGKVMRIGHMGTQADEQVVRHGMQVLGEVIDRLRQSKKE